MNDPTYHVDRAGMSRRRRVRRTLWSLAALAVIALAFWVKQQSRPNTVIHQAKPTTTVISLKPTQSFTLKTFRINLPQDWKQVKPDNDKVSYRWQGMTRENDARSLDVYVDTIPAGFAVNRTVPVAADDSGIQVTGSVSNNCSTFTLASATDPRTGIAPSKWDGLDFLCDMGNNLRDVVGTTSGEGVNTVTVAGPSGTHRYFFVYTDHSGEPEFETFTNALGSFQAL